jgi:hypothetical protein
MPKVLKHLMQSIQGAQPFKVSRVRKHPAQALIELQQPVVRIEVTCAQTFQEKE